MLFLLETVKIGFCEWNNNRNLNNFIQKSDRFQNGIYLTILSCADLQYVVTPLRKARNPISFSFFQGEGARRANEVRGAGGEVSKRNLHYLCPKSNPPGIHISGFTHLQN
jgi:hypothetical protein